MAQKITQTCSSYCSWCINSPECDCNICWLYESASMCIELLIMTKWFSNWLSSAISCNSQFFDQIKSLAWCFHFVEFFNLLQSQFLFHHHLFSQNSHFNISQGSFVAIGMSNLILFFLDNGCRLQVICFPPWYSSLYYVSKE